MNIVAYCRVSTSKEDQLNSLEVQKLFFEEYSKKNNHNLVKIYADEGISGTKTKNRKEFQRMMKDSENNLFEMVVVKDISRLARNAVDFLQGIRYLKSKSVACNFVNTNLTSSDSEMVLGTLALVAQEESANTSKRIKMSKKINAEKGRVPNFVFGYDKIHGDYFNLSINQAEANTVKRIFRMYVNEGYGTNKIANTLNSEGIRTKLGNTWSQNSIIRILKNEIYNGKIINGKEEITDFLTGSRVAKESENWFITENESLKIVDDDTFKTAEEIRTGRNVAFSSEHTRHSNKHLFSGLIKCSDCGYSYRRRVRPNSVIDWLCNGRNTNGAGCCSNKTLLDEKYLMNEIEVYFTELLRNKPTIIKNIVTKFNHIYKAENENIENQRTLNIKKEKLNISRGKVIQMFEDDVIDRDEMKRRMTDLNTRLKKVESELKIVEYIVNKGEALESLMDKTFKNIENISKIELATNAALKQIIEKIVVDEQGNISIFLRLLSDIGLDSTFLISDIFTYGGNIIENINIEIK